MSLKNFSLLEHLTELQSRLIKIISFISLGFIISYFFKEQLLDLISSPIRPYLLATDGYLIYISPFEKFFSYLWLSFFSGVILSCPFWFYQIWKFISPALYKNEKKWSLFFVSCSCLLFISGILFVYFMVYPLSFRFLLSFSGKEMAYISLGPYLSFFLRSCFVFACVFEMPLFLLVLLKLNLVSVQQLKMLRPYVFVGIACLSAIITPPDIFSMIFMMIPLYIFFEVTIFLGSKLLK